jgi:type III pantothenate kinase
VHDGLFLPGTAIDYRQTGLVKSLQPVWSDLPPPGILALASVADLSIRDEVRAIVKHLWPQIKYVEPRVTTSAFGVSNAYRQPEKLGIDRWLALLATHHYYPGASCIVDCGTAITVDVIASEGRHLGGWICPGLSTMQKSLFASTAALPFTERRHTGAIAATTAEAIANGVFLAAVGFIEAVLARLAMPCRLLLCGGDAELIAAELSRPCVIDAELVLRGLSLFCASKDST